MKSCPHESPLVFWLNRAWISLERGRKSMGSQCFKKQQTKEIRQIFANIQTWLWTAKILWDSSEKPSLRYEERALTGTAQTDQLLQSQPLPSLRAWCSWKLWARLSQSSAEVHLYAQESKTSWLVTAEGCCCTLLCALEFGWNMLQPQGVLAVQGCKRDMHEAVMSWMGWLSLHANHSKLSLLCQKNRVEEPLWIKGQSALEMQ